MQRSSVPSNELSFSFPTLHIAKSSFCAVHCSVVWTIKTNLLLMYRFDISRFIQTYYP